MIRYLQLIQGNDDCQDVASGTANVAGPLTSRVYKPLIVDSGLPL